MTPASSRVRLSRRGPCITVAYPARGVHDRSDMDPHRRSLPLASLLVLLLFLAPGGCGDGDGDTGALRIDVTTYAVDGPPPDGMTAVPIEAPPDSEVSYPLAPVAGGPTGLYVVEGAPEGSYRVEGPGGWWMLQATSRAPELERGRIPPRIRMGRSHTLYLAASAPSIRPGRRWSAVRIVENGASEPIPIEVAPDPEGWVVALRFRAEDWRGKIQVTGHIEPGPLGARAPDAPPGPLAEAIRFEATTSGRPLAIQVRQAPSSPFDVVLVPASPGAQVDDVEVCVRVADFTPPVEECTHCRGGVAHFAAIPAMGHDLLVTVGGDPFAHRLTPEVRKRQANLRVLHPAGATIRVVRAKVPAGTNLDPADLCVQVRPLGAVAFARVPFRLVQGRREEGGTVVFRAPAGPFAAWLRTGSRWAFVEGAGDMPIEITHATFEKGVRVEGPVRGRKGMATVRMFFVMGEEAVLGDGFEVRVTPSGTYEALLPIGTWHVEVATRLGDWRQPIPLVVDAPGSTIHLPLRMP